MQAGQIVARDRSIHMMLGVKVHVPVEELHQRIDRKRPAAQPEVWDIVLQTDVLRVVAHEEKPASVAWNEACQNRKQPHSGKRR